MTYKNQHIIIGYTEKIKKPYIMISEDEMEVAARLLSAKGLLLWIYMHKIKTNKKTWGLSRIDVEKYTGIKESTYRTQKKELERYGYLRKISGSTYQFYPYPHEEYTKGLVDGIKNKDKKNQVESERQQEDSEEEILIEGLDYEPEQPKEDKEEEILIEGLDYELAPKIPIQKFNTSRKYEPPEWTDD
jgi:hypothetical protein